MNGFGEFESTSGLIMMFRRVVFSLGLYPFAYSADLFLTTWCYATGGSFCSWGVLVLLVGIDRRRREGLAAGRCCMKQLPLRSTKKSNGTVCEDGSGFKGCIEWSVVG